MKPRSTSYEPPNSLSVLIGLAVQRRRTLLKIYIITLAIAIPVAVTVVGVGLEDTFRIFDSGFSWDIDFDETTVFDFSVVILVLGIIAILTLYGGGTIGTLSTGWVDRIQRWRLWPWFDFMLKTPLIFWLLRMNLPLLGFVTLIGVIFAELGVALLEVTERRVGGLDPARALVENGFLSELDEMVTSLMVGLVIGFIIVLVCVWKTQRFEALQRLTLVGWLFSFYASVLWSALLMADTLFFGQADTELNEAILIITCSTFFIFSGAGLRLLFLRKQPIGDILAPQSSNQRAVAGEANLSSARVFAVVLLGVWYVALTVAVEQATQLSWVMEARQVFAAQYLDDVHVTGSDPSTLGLPLLLGTPEIKSTSSSGLFSSTSIQGVLVTQTDGKTWTALPTKPFDAGENPEFAKIQLLTLAARAGIPFNEQPSFYAMFGDFLTILMAYRQQFTVPVIAISVRPDHATWALAGLTLILLLVIRNRVRRIYMDPTLAVTQPWLVLDWRGRIEQLTASMWLLLLLLGPWVANAGLVLTLAAQNSAEGGLTSVPGDVFRLCLMLGFLTFSAWIAVLTVVDLICLRKARREYLGDGKQRRRLKLFQR